MLSLGHLQPLDGDPEIPGSYFIVKGWATLAQMWKGTEDAFLDMHWAFPFWPFDQRHRLLDLLLLVPSCRPL